MNCACARQERDVSQEVRDLFLSQTVGKKGRLPNFQTMKTEELEAGWLWDFCSFGSPFDPTDFRFRFSDAIGEYLDRGCRRLETGQIDIRY